MSGPAPNDGRPATAGCQFCWMCRHVCPVGLVTSRETLTPHAWALTIESVRRGQLRWTEETAAVLYACADCGLCRTHCVTDQPLPDAIVAARADVVRAGAAPQAVERYRASLVPRNPTSAPMRSPSSVTVASGRALFAGGAAASQADEISAALALLEAAGRSAEAVGDGLDTGLTASALGLVDEARRLAEHVVATIVRANVRELLVTRPADKWTFEYVYPVRLGVAWPEGVSLVEVTTVLADALDQRRLHFASDGPTGAAYHDPCHSPRLGRDADAPRRLLAAVSPSGATRELFWRRERAHPCGAIGGLAVTHPDLARQLTAAHFADASAAGATALVTDDPVCLAELREHAGRTLEVRGLFTMLASHLELGA